MEKKVLRYYLNDMALENGVTFKEPSIEDAGFDLPCSIKEFIIPPHSLASVPTGLHLEIPRGWVGIIKDRSSVSLKNVITLAGVIDSGYRGEIKVLMHNLGNQEVKFLACERIAQCVILPHFIAHKVKRVDSLKLLEETKRGSKGFGSSGK